MSGHSKWSTIKRKKGAADAKRGQLFTRLAREISIAAREGGNDIDANFKLRLAVDRARKENMPKENIERAIKRGTGEDKSGANIERVTYEGYAANGIALMIECLTENRNRTVAELKHVLTRGGGSMAEVGSVSWQFNHICYFEIPAEKVNFDSVFEVAVENGADDISSDDNTIEVFGPVEVFKTLNNGLRQSGFEPDEVGLRYVPKQEISLDTDKTLKVLRTMEDLENLDDVQEVFSNLEITDEALQEIETA